MDSPNDVVGHKTFDTGERCSETGMPLLRHEPLTRAEAEALSQRADELKRQREEKMPDEKAAILVLFDAWQRLKELGWTGGVYCPKDGTHFRAIELGSTGIFDCVCEGEWPRCTWMTYDEHDVYPSSRAPALIKLYPEDQAKYDARLAEAAARFREETDKTDDHNM